MRVCALTRNVFVRGATGGVSAGRTDSAQPHTEMGFPDMSIDIEMNNSMQMFLIGVSMAIVGNTLIAC